MKELTGFLGTTAALFTLGWRSHMGVFDDMG